MSKQIAKAAKALKKSLDEYNNISTSSRCSLPPSLAHESVAHPDADIWKEFADTGSVTSAVPVSVRRKAIDLYHQLDRCKEEINLVQEEMRNTFSHFCRQQEIVKSLFFDSTSVNQLAVERGKDILFHKKLLYIESHLIHLKKTFEEHINVTMPSLYIFSEAESQQRAHTEAMDAVDNSEDDYFQHPISMSEKADSDSDVSDSDDEYCSDIDSAFFSLDYS